MAPSLPIFALAETILKTRSAVVIPDVLNDSLTKDIPNPAPGGFAFTAFAGLPLVADRKVVGILSIYMTRGPHEFTSGGCGAFADRSESRGRQPVQRAPVQNGP